MFNLFDEVSGGGSFDLEDKTFDLNSDVNGSADDLRMTTILDNVYTRSDSNENYGLDFNDENDKENYIGNYSLVKKVSTENNQNYSTYQLRLRALKTRNYSQLNTPNFNNDNNSIECFYVTKRKEEQNDILNVGNNDSTSVTSVEEVTALPLARKEIENKVIYYTGETINEHIIQNTYYKCVKDEEQENTYYWQEMEESIIIKQMVDIGTYIAKSLPHYGVYGIINQPDSSLPSRIRFGAQLLSRDIAPNDYPSGGNN